MNQPVVSTGSPGPKQNLPKPSMSENSENDGGHDMDFRAGSRNDPMNPAPDTGTSTVRRRRGLGFLNRLGSARSGGGTLRKMGSQFFRNPFSTLDLETEPNAPRSAPPSGGRKTPDQGSIMGNIEDERKGRRSRSGLMDRAKRVRREMGSPREQSIEEFVDDGRAVIYRYLDEKKSASEAILRKHLSNELGPITDDNQWRADYLLVQLTNEGWLQGEPGFMFCNVNMAMED